MKQLFILGLVATAIYLLLDGGQSQKTLYKAFKKEYSLSFTSEEDILRFNNFKENLDIIKASNSDPTNTFTLGITPFAHMSAQEFKETILMKGLLGRSYQDGVFVQNDRTNMAEVDWTSKGVLTGVKNQGSCGSCWSFSTTGVIQASVKISKGTLYSLSEQQLVDCCGSKGFGCQGCSGAWPQDAMSYIAKNGIELQTQYPYTAKDGSCKAANGMMLLNSQKPWVMIPKGDVNSLATALGKTPVSVCVDASKWSLYKGGIFNNCKVQPLDHAVLLVGVTADGIWKIKNSWGTGWGQNGFIRLAAGNTCGVAQHGLVVNVA